MKLAYKVLLGLMLLWSACDTPRIVPQHYQSENLLVRSLTDRAFVHTSYLATEKYGKVACNGVVYIRNGEAVVLDTPVDSSAAVELINWIEKQRHASIKAVIPTHFHVDCLGSLAEFHERDIPSYAHAATIALARKAEAALPQRSFTESMSLSVGNKKVSCRYFGAGHTRDNIVVYLPDEEVLFGGCLIKSNGAGKGNLADADTTAWPQTVQQVQRQYPNVKYVVPGHGKTGNRDLLGYTISLFSQ